MMKILILMNVLMTCCICMSQTKKEFVAEILNNEMSTTKIQLSKLTDEINTITNDMRRFRQIYNSKKVNKTIKKSEWVYMSKNAKYLKTTVETNKFYYIDRLVLAMKDQELSDIYKRYIGCDSSDMCKDLSYALENAESEHEQVVNKMKSNKKTYDRKKSELIKERQKKLLPEISRLKREISNLEKMRPTMHAKKCGCSICTRINDKIDVYNAEIRAYDVGNIVSDLADRSEKNIAEILVMDNDSTLAKYGLENEKRRIYEEFKEKFAGKLMSTLKLMVDTKSEHIKQLTARYQNLQFLQQHPDMIPNVAIDKISEKTIYSALGNSFDVDVSEIDAEDKRRQEEEKQHMHELKMLEQQHNHQKEMEKRRQQAMKDEQEFELQKIRNKQNEIKEEREFELQKIREMNKGNNIHVYHEINI